MPVDPSLVGRTYAPTEPYAVTAEAVGAFASALDPGAEPGPAADSGPKGPTVPATFPVVVAFASMNGFLADEGLELSRIVHGDQKFSYRRPVRVGDVLTSTLTVTGLRQIGGNDLIATSSTIRDGAGEVVCDTSATLVHRGGAS